MSERHRTGRPSLIVGVLALAGVAASFVQTIVIPIQASLPSLLNASSADTPWVITATLLAAAVCTPVAGRLGDIYGKRRVTLVLLALLAAGSVVAGLTSDLWVMVFARALQGTAAGLIPLGISMLRDVLPAERLAPAVGLVSATLGVGGAIGLPLSAVLAQYFDWHMLFWLTAIIAASCFLLCLRFVPSVSGRVAAKVDVPGIIGLSTGLVGVLIALSRGSEWGWNDPRTLTCLIGGLVILVVWVFVELRVKDPLVDLRGLTKPAVFLTNVASAGLGFSLFASNIALPQLLTLPEGTSVGLGMSLVTAALVLAPSGIAMMIASAIAGRLIQRLGAKALLVAGSAVTAAVYAILLFAHTEPWQILLVAVLSGAGIGIGYAAMPSLIMDAVPPTQTAAANGFDALTRSLGTSVASVVIGAVLAHSVTDQSGIAAPSQQGFLTTFAIGLLAAAACVLIALFIPNTTSTLEENMTDDPESGNGDTERLRPAKQAEDSAVDGSEFRVLGTEGPALLLLPGGGESVHGFFPGITEALLEDPGCRVILYDRPGTGTNVLPGSLEAASSDLHAALQRHKVGPVIVIGQSLGGAVATLLARDYPDDVAGLVLLDPSAVNDARFAAFTERSAQQQARLSRVPIVRHVIAAAMTIAAGRMLRGRELPPDARAALSATFAADMVRTRKAVTGLAHIAGAFDEHSLPIVPAVVVTADRNEKHPFRQAHARLAVALHAPLVQWPTAVHPVHLTHTELVVDVCRQVLASTTR